MGSRLLSGAELLGVSLSALGEEQLWAVSCEQ
jgi:hypothetical protein